jgi:hypothetical protein
MFAGSGAVTPVLVIGFNRPELTRELFILLRKVKPQRLYFACDGPRETAAEDYTRIALLHASIELVDWECEVKTLFQPTNLGCGKGVSTAISWFLGQESAGIILEDDIRPSLDFFPFASEMLSRYATDSRVWSISGLNVDPPSVVSSQADSYRFSAFPLVWGWATWARAWEAFDLDITNWPTWLDLDDVCERNRLPYPAKLLLRSRISQAASGKVDTWDYQWMAKSLSANALHIVPRWNLSQNVGIFYDSTHIGYDHVLLREAEPIELPIIHPTDVGIDFAADRTMLANYFEATWLGLARKVMRRATRAVSARSPRGRLVAMGAKSWWDRKRVPTEGHK